MAIIRLFVVGMGAARPCAASLPVRTSALPPVLRRAFTQSTHRRLPYVTKDSTTPSDGKTPQSTPGAASKSKKGSFYEGERDVSHLTDKKKAKNTAPSTKITKPTTIPLPPVAEKRSAPKRPPSAPEPPPINAVPNENRKIPLTLKPTALTDTRHSPPRIPPHLLPRPGAHRLHRLLEGHLPPPRRHMHRQHDPRLPHHRRHRPLLHRQYVSPFPSPYAPEC